MRSSITGDQLRPEDQGPTFFLGKNMTIYRDNVPIESSDEEIRANMADQEV